MDWKRFALEDREGMFAEYGSGSSGLSLKEAHLRLERYGKNALEPKHSIFLEILKRRFRSAFLYLLLAAAALSFFLGQFFEALLILVFVGINVSLEVYQEYHSEEAAKLLKRYLVIRSRVRRAGKVMTIESSQIVPGDIILLEVGDRLPADVRFLETAFLEIDESLITGESIAVSKTDKLLPVPPLEMYEAANIGFAGTVVTHGRGEGIVFATGDETALGDIAHLAETTERETVFEKEITQFSRFILKLVFFTLAIIFIANIFIKGSEVNAIEFLVFTLALAVSVVPEALPVILTVALSRGALRLAQKKVIVKRLSAIEDLGSIEVLCTDKTGTLTENLLSVRDVFSEKKEHCLEAAFLACLEVPEKRGLLHDAFDLALWQKLSHAKREELASQERYEVLPFDPARRRNGVVADVQGETRLIVRGAPEEVLRLCRDVDLYRERSLMQWVKEAGRRGERVLAVASKTLPRYERGKVHEDHLEFLGLISFSDSLKPTAIQTIERARALGVQVKILTGDGREVAGAVGYAIGLLSDPEQALTWKDLEAMSPIERREAVFRGSVFARVSPREKYEILKILKEKHEVGFLGEGINDAPVLKLANVALVVSHASDIAREAADVVLLDKNLETIIDGIGEGRKIFANILKYLKITLTSNFGNFYSVALASLMLPFVPLLPTQILLLNLLSDFPMIAIATDNVDTEELEMPKNYQVHSIVLFATFFGIISSVFDFTLFGIFAQFSEATLQTAWFLLSIATEIVLIFSLRSRKPFFRAKRPPFLLLYLSLVVFAIAFALPFTPFGDRLGFIQPNPFFLLLVVALVAAYFFATEALKRFYYQHFQEGRFAFDPKADSR